MRLYFDNRFRFLGFSHNVPGIYFLLIPLAVVLIPVFIALLPLWYYLSMKNWEKWAYTDSSFFFDNRERVMEMTKQGWNISLCAWFLWLIILITQI